jgi:hypothetical protein
MNVGGGLPVRGPHHRLIWRGQAWLRPFPDKEEIDGSNPSARTPPRLLTAGPDTRLPGRRMPRRAGLLRGTPRVLSPPARQWYCLYGLTDRAADYESAGAGSIPARGTHVRSGSLPRALTLCLQGARRPSQRMLVAIASQLNGSSRRFLLARLQVQILPGLREHPDKGAYPARSLVVRVYVGRYPRAVGIRYVPGNPRELGYCPEESGRRAVRRFSAGHTGLL